MREFDDFDLTEYNSYRIKSKCVKAYFPENIDDIKCLFSSNNYENLVVIGNGNNIILSESYYDKEFVIFNATFNKVSCCENEISAEAGATLQDVAEIAKQYALSGFESFFDIPSSIGGAAVMNAGVKDISFSNVATKIKYLSIDTGDVFECKVEDLQYSYRQSLFQNDRSKIVLEVVFHLNIGRKKEITKKMLSIRNNRISKQPRDYPNCGSVFKRPKGKFVGPMIEELGLKGYRIGGAQVSNKHAGFIINKHGATGRDILNLVAFIQDEVHKKYQIDLELEQRVI